MSKIEAFKNYLGIDDVEDITTNYGNCYEYNRTEYEILTYEEVIDYAKDLISDELDMTLHEAVPEYLHNYFNREQYIDDNIDQAFDYVDFGYGYEKIEDNDSNIYYLFRI